MLILYLSLIDEENKKSKFEELYLAYRRQMILVAKSVVHNDSDAEDVVHEVFFNIAMRHMDTICTITEEKTLKNYLLTATKRTAINWLRRYKNMVYAEPEMEIDYMMPEIPDDRFIDYICNRLEYEQVLKAMAELEGKYKFVMYYHFVLEIPVPEVAETLCQSVATTKKQLVRGKKKLLALLEEKGELSNDERRV